MHRFILYPCWLHQLTLVICVYGMTAFVFTEAACGDTLKIMTFNIKYDYGDGSDPEISWDCSSLDSPSDRRDRVVNVIGDYMPDILGVQEMLTSQLTYLQNSGALSSYGYYGVGRDDGVNSGERSGIFYNASLLSLVNAGEFWLSDTPQTPGTTFNGNGGDKHNSRIATWVVLQDLSNPARQYFAVDTHWSLDGQARLESGSLIHRMIEELSGGLPVIVMGDLNECHGDAGCQALLGSDGDAVQLADAYDESGSPQGITSHGWLGGVEGERIDHILCSEGDFSVVPGSGDIIRTKFEYGYPSDHYAVTVEMTVLVPEPPAFVLLTFAAVGLVGCASIRRFFLSNGD